MHENLVYKNAKARLPDPRSVVAMCTACCQSLIIGERLVAAAAAGGTSTKRTISVSTLVAALPYLR